MAPIVDENSSPLAVNGMDVVHSRPISHGSIQKPTTPSRGIKRKSAYEMHTHREGAKKAVAISPLDGGSSLAGPATGSITDARLPLGENQAVDEPAIKVSFDSLESYKEMIDAIALLHNTKEDDEHLEWSNPASSFMMGYAICTDEDVGHEESTHGNNACALKNDTGSNDEQNEWRDPTTGVVMGYAIWEDEEIEMAMEYIQGAESCSLCTTIESNGNDDAEWKDSCTGVVMGYATCTDKEIENIMEDMELGENMCKDEKFESLTGEDHDTCAQQAAGDETMQNPNACARSGCAECEDLADVTASMQMCTDLYNEFDVEWEDVVTHTIMGYASCARDDMEAVAALFEENAVGKSHESSSESDELTGNQNSSDGPDSLSADSASYSSDDTSSCDADVDGGAIRSTAEA